MLSKIYEKRLIAVLSKICERIKCFAVGSLVLYYRISFMVAVVLMFVRCLSESQVKQFCHAQFHPSENITWKKNTVTSLYDFFTQLSVFSHHQVDSQNVELFLQRARFPCLCVTTKLTVSTCKILQYSVLINVTVTAVIRDEGVLL